MGRTKESKRPKKKSIKTKAINLNSKRKLAKFGKKQKKGHNGVVIRYITRSRALRKLQLSLRDFRRLCILKGIYPREPPNRTLNKTCYHVKDIAFLSHEPLLEKFTQFKAFMKKVHRHLNRKDDHLAKRLYESRTPYTLEHLIRERYPRFSDSLADMDDALCLVHLFASMYSKGRIRSGRIENCLRLTREWQLYVVMSHSLRKTFVSVKGIYYQAEVHGEKITWIVPHKFAQDVPKEVDVRVMSTFLEFYESFLGFVLYKLYHNLGLRYPPRLDQALDSSGAHLASLQPEPRDSVAQENSADDENEEEEEEEGEEEGESDSNSDSDEAGDPDVKSKERIVTLTKRLHEIVKEEEDDDEAEESMQNDEDRAMEKEVFAEDEQAQKVDENAKRIESQTNLLKGLTFWLSREVPFEPLEFVIRSFGGGLASDLSNSSVTHAISDRPNLARTNKNVEYVQPQWVFDSVNFSLLLPVKRYAIGEVLPPHLSPFVNNESVGYKPEYAEEIEKLQTASGVKLQDANSVLLYRDLPPERDEDKMEEGDSGSSSSEEEEEEEQEEEGESESSDEEKKEVEAPKKSKIQTNEKKVEIDIPKKPTRTKKKAVETEQKVADESGKEFIKSKKFAGPRKGYYFGKGSQGLGYYADHMAGKVFKLKLPKVNKRLEQKKQEHKMRTMMMSNKAKRLYNKMQHGKKRKKQNADILEQRKQQLKRKKGKR